MILSDLNPWEMALLEKLGATKHYAPGDMIIREGEAGSSFFLVLEGRVEVRKNIGLDKYKKLVELGALDIFGEVCFLGVECRSASVLALEKTHVMEFPGDKLETLINTNPAIGLKLYRGIARELAQRLATVDVELKDALVWALGDHKNAVMPDATCPKKLSLARPDANGSVTAKIVIE